MRSRSGIVGGASAVARAAIAIFLALAGAPSLAQAPIDESGVPSAPKQGLKPKPEPKAKAPKASKAPETPPAPTPSNPVPAPFAPVADRPGLTVACGGKAALFEGPNAFTLWVTRSGAIVVENPLRPLTPETTRVLQVVIGGKAATAFGPDLFALRRGGSPGALEAMAGGPVRWDATMATLPDTLAIVSEAGAPMASLAFRECGEAPAVKAAPVAGKPKAPLKPVPKRPIVKPAEKPDAGARTPPGFQLPQGAIP